MTDRASAAAAPASIDGGRSATSSTGLADLTAGGAGELLEQRRISSVELVRAVLERMDATEPQVHAYAHRFDEVALSAAGSADGEPRRSPLHGVPFAVKDTLHLSGQPTEAGSAQLAGAVSAFDATVVARFRAAGAVPVGKHGTHEFALGHDVADARNPWDTDRFPGGSSSGGGVSVAVGSAPLAIGTDAGGSTRVPAALTGVVGFKPTYGRVSTYGTVAGAAVPGTEHVGLFARTAADVAAALHAVAGPDPHDPRTVDLPPFVAQPAGGLAGVRIGVLRSVHRGQRTDPDVAELVAAGVGVLGGLGASLVEIEADLGLAGPALAILVASAASATHLPALQAHPERFTPGVRRFLRAGLLIPAHHVLAARAVRTAVRDQVAALFRAHRLDLVASPTAPVAAPLVDRFDPVTDTGPLTAFASVANLTGQPAVSVPCGFTTGGLPAGLQLVGRPLGDAAVLHAAAAYQSVTSWHRRRPAVARSVPERAGASR